MYITEIDLGGHGECVECNLGPYRFEKPSKNQLNFMKIITIGIPIQMDMVYLDYFHFRKNPSHGALWKSTAPSSLKRFE